MITKAQRRAHLQAVIASAKLREQPADSSYARSALSMIPKRSLANMSRHAALRKSLISETPGGDRPYVERLRRTGDYPNISLEHLDHLNL